MNKYRKLLVSLGFIMTMHANNTANEFKIYRKPINYPMISVGILTGALSVSSMFLNNIDPTTKYIMSGTLGVTSVSILLYLLNEHKNKNKPALIINEKGLWYDGIWFKRNLAWDDITRISWDETSSGFLSFYSLTISSRLHFSFTIPTWGLDIEPQKLWDMIQQFYKGEEDN